MCGLCVQSLLCNAVLSTVFCFTFFKLTHGGIESWLLCLYSFCRVAVSVLCLFLAESSVGQWSVIATFPGHSFLHFSNQVQH